MKTHNRYFLIILLFMLSGMFGFITSLYLHRDNASKMDNEVAVRQTFHYPATFVKQLRNDPEAGKKIFKEFCAVCHDKTPSIDVHAPRIGDKTWLVKQQMGIDALLKLTVRGLGAMPARGGCFECSDEQLRETIKYILRESK